MITDDELAVLVICACFSQNVLIKHHFTSSHLKIMQKIDKAPAGHCCGSVEIQKSSCGSRHCCGSGEKHIRLLWERSLLWQWGAAMGGFGDVKKGWLWWV